MSKRILVVDNEERMCELLKAGLESVGLPIDTAYNGEAAWESFSEESHVLVITDLKMPKLTGLELLDRIKQSDAETDVILMTAFATAQTAVQAMKQGAYDYLIKPFDMEELRLKVDRLLEKQKLQHENKDLRQQLKTRYGFDNIVGHSGKMADVFRMVEKVSDGDTTVLIRGESGTGKELIAQAIHQSSPRSTEPFIAVNCGAIPENLLESELFGHEKGAFTGADRSKVGKFELAGGGTIFLDEIGDLSPTLQVKLLRVLQSRQIERVGGNDVINLRARVIAATHRDLEESLKSGTFREDLYYRINVFPIFLPPLRDRRDDIPELIEHFLNIYANEKAISVATEARETLDHYHWPGNVRELENVIERAVILCSDGRISKDHLPQHLLFQRNASFFAELPDEGIILEDHERSLIREALKKAKGNKSKAAGLLGITRRRLYSMMERLGVTEQ